MKIAVLMSTYNGEKYIKEQIESILNQNGEFEVDLIIRDDGSTDKTKEIINSYEQLKVINNLDLNLGPALSFLTLLKDTIGYDFYAFADQDDYWLDNKLNKAILTLKNCNKPELYCSNAIVVDQYLDNLGRNVYKTNPPLDFKTLCCSGGLLGCTMVFNKKLAKLIQEYPLPENIIMHDFYVALVCLINNGKIYFDEEPTLLYRQHGNNTVGVSTTIKQKVMKYIKSFYKKPKVSIATQAKELLDIYKVNINLDNSEWLKKIINYKKTYFSSLFLAVSFQTKYMNLNSSIKNRLTIFLHNK